MNFICNEVPDRVNKNSLVCSLHFTTDSFTNKAQFDMGFSKKLKLKDDAVQTILDLTVRSQHTSVSNCFYYMITIAVTRRTRREASGSICKLFITKHGHIQARSEDSKQVWHGQDTRVVLRTAWVGDRRTLSRGLGRENNPGARAGIRTQEI